MTDQSVFEQKPKKDVVPQPDSSLFNDQLSMIKNDNGEPKYDSVPKALEALQHSQQYIPEIKTQLEARDQEIADLKEKLTKASTLDEVVDKFTASQAPASEATPAPTPALDEQAIISILESHSAQQTQAQAAQANEMAVSKALTEKFGDKATEALIGKAAEMGMSTEDLKSLAQKSPAAALQLFGTSTVATQKPVQSSVSIPVSQGQQSGLAPPEKSLLAGSTYKDQLDYLNKVRQAVHEKHGVQP